MNICGLCHSFLISNSNQLESNVESETKLESNLVSVFLKNSKFTYAINCVQFEAMGLLFYLKLVFIALKISDQL